MAKTKEQRDAAIKKALDEEEAFEPTPTYDEQWEQGDIPRLRTGRTRRGESVRVLDSRGRPVQIVGSRSDAKPGENYVLASDLTPREDELARDAIWERGKEPRLMDLGITAGYAGDSWEAPPSERKTRYRDVTPERESWSTGDPIAPMPDDPLREQFDAAAAQWEQLSGIEKVMILRRIPMLESILFGGMRNPAEMRELQERFSGENPPHKTSSPESDQ